jgi:superfamily II DNA or RNA helicase
MNLTHEEMQEMVATMTPADIKTWVQDEALKAWRENQYRGTFEGATGVGKSRVGVMAAAHELEVNPNARVYVAAPTETLRDDEWPSEFEKWGYGHLKDKVIRICHVSMDKVRDEEIDLLVWDECHHATPANSAFFRNNKVFRTLGLTATLPKGTKNDNDRDKKLILDTICPSVFKVTLEEAIELGLVADFEVKVIMFDLDTEEKYLDGGSKNTPFKTTEASQYMYLTKMMQRMAMAKNEGAKFIWIQKRTQLLRNLRSKERLAKEIMSHMIKETNRTLVFCGGIEQSQRLCGEWVYHSQTGDEKLIQFKEKQIHFLGVVNALNEGKNIEDLDQSLIVQLSSNERDAIQRIGRNVRWRPNHKAQIVILVARKTADEKWYREAFKMFNKERIKEYLMAVPKPELSTVQEVLNGS